MTRRTPKSYLLKHYQNRTRLYKKNGEETKPVERFTFLVSIVALSISIVSLYFQFFYEKHELVMSFIQGDFHGDSILSTKLIYHNKGNQYATILGNRIVFYNSHKDPDSSGVSFTSDGVPTSENGELNPVVLSPTQQFYREYSQNFNLRKFNIDTSWMKVTDTMKIGIEVGFINSEGFYSRINLPIGWVTLDSLKAVESFEFNLQTTSLKSDRYFVANYRHRPKQQ